MMATLSKKKINFNRYTRRKDVLTEVGVSATKDNSGVYITINIDPDNGDEQYMLFLDDNDLLRIVWALP